MILAGGSGDCYAPKPLLGFKATASKTKYNVSASARDLTAYHGGAGGGATLGLAYAPLYYEYKYEYQITQQGENICVAVDKMKIYYRARPMVFISSDFPRGSCEFKAVVNHENKHVKTLLKEHKKTAKKFRDHVQDAILQVRPVKVKSELQINAAQEKIDKEIKANLDEYMQKVNDRLAREQIKVDSPTEYDRVHALCEDWAGLLRAD